MVHTNWALVNLNDDFDTKFIFDYLLNNFNIEK